MRSNLIVLGNKPSHFGGSDEIVRMHPYCIIMPLGFHHLFTLVNAKNDVLERMKMWEGKPNSEIIADVHHILHYLDQNKHRMVFYGVVKDILVNEPLYTITVKTFTELLGVFSMYPDFVNSIITLEGE